MNKPRKLRSRKAGLPPGTLLHIGEKKTSHAAFSFIDFDEQGLREGSLHDAAALSQQPRLYTTRWANVYGASAPSDLAAIGTTFGLHPLTSSTRHSGKSWTATRIISTSFSTATS